MSKSSIETINQYKGRLAKIWIKHEVVGNQNKTLTYSHQENLEPDGRKRNRVISDLCNNGYLNMVDGNIHITGKAFNEIKSSKPDLNKVLGSYLNHAPAGVCFDDLDIGAQKYLFDNKDKYQFFYESKYSGRTQVQAEFGVAPDFDKVYDHRFMVKDTAFDEARQKFIDDVEFQQMRKGNLAWGLNKLGLLSEKDIDVVKLKNQSSPFSPGGFKPEPASWPTDLDTELERLQHRIDESTKCLDVLIAVKTNMTGYGGWDKFLVNYDELIVEEIKKEKTLQSQTAN